MWVKGGGAADAAPGRSRRKLGAWGFVSPEKQEENAVLTDPELPERTLWSLVEIGTVGVEPFRGSGTGYYYYYTVIKGEKHFFPGCELLLFILEGWNETNKDS